ncbi:hypothetical protein DOY81_014691, partial [Sarcophaga bullata]
SPAMHHSEELYKAAQQLIPGGVNSPVRAFNGVGGTPLFIERADGAYIYDADGKAYIDYVGSWGPMVLRSQPFHPIRDALCAPTAAEVRNLAKLVGVVISVPSIDMIRMVELCVLKHHECHPPCSLVIRVRDKIIKFEGCYHASCDCLLGESRDICSPSIENYPDDIACSLYEPGCVTMNCRSANRPEFITGVFAHCVTNLMLC